MYACMHVCVYYVLHYRAEIKYTHKCIHICTIDICHWMIHIQSSMVWITHTFSPSGCDQFERSVCTLRCRQFDNTGIPILSVWSSVWVLLIIHSVYHIAGKFDCFGSLPLKLPSTLYVLSPYAQYWVDLTPNHYPSLKFERIHNNKKELWLSSKRLKMQ